MGHLLLGDHLSVHKNNMFTIGIFCIGRQKVHEMSPFSCTVPRNWFLSHRDKNGYCLLLPSQSLNTHVVNNVN